MFSSEASVQSLGIRLFSNAAVSHVFLYLGDGEIAEAVGAGVRELVAEGRSVVVVAHRIATVRHADRILFLDGGRLVEAGDHEALLAAGGRYADFWRERRAAAGWTIRP